MPKWSVQFSLESIDEIEKAIEYYNTQKVNLGFEFSLEFEKQIELLMINPYTHAIRYLNVRLAMLEKFPYAIHYTISEAKNMIIVQTLLSTFRNPETNWKRRL